MPDRPASPYLTPGFYEAALARGRHRQIVGGWWEETGRIQLDLLRAEGLRPHHHILDIGAGSLRLGCKAVPFLDPGHYWATDASGALMRRGWEVELEDKARLSPAHLIEDAEFRFPGVPPDIDFAIAWGVFTHLPQDDLARALPRIRAVFPGLSMLLFTVFLSPGPGAARGGDDAVTHSDRAPYHYAPEAVMALCAGAGFRAQWRDIRLPRGQRLCVALPA